MVKLIFVIVTLICTVPCILSQLGKKENPFQTLNPWSTFSYPVINYYKVQTSDGYLLKLFHVSDKTNSTKARPAVLLMHGLMSSSIDFAFGESEGLVLTLIKNGYDVYLGNTRGSYYGMSHIYLDPIRDPAFWQFSFDEIATKDLPAIVEKVLEISGQSKIGYVGHMEGSMVFYMMISAIPKYAMTFYHMVSLGPMAFISNTSNRILRSIITNHGSQGWVIQNLGQGMFRPSNELLSYSQTDCQNPITGTPIEAICENYYFLFKGFNSNNLNMTTVHWVLLNVPFGGSVNQFLHLAQMAEVGKFQTYAVEWDKPMMTKGYNLTDVEVPISLYYTPKDILSSVKDIKVLTALLPNVITDKNFDQLTNNIDLLYSNNVATNVYSLVVKSLKPMVKSSSYARHSTY